MEYIVLGLFCISLLLCISLNISIIYALLAGLILFMLYGRHKGFSWKSLISMAINGIKTVSNILITFILIGVMTALWRASGTIPFIVSKASTLIRPSVFLLMTFLLNSGLSVLTGTSFGTSATMGVICASMGSTMGVSPMLTGGAVLSGAFFGDRCSPVSTSALLVAGITGTDIYKNIRGMIRTSLIPFIAACVIYFAIGVSVSAEGPIMDLKDLFSASFRLEWITVIPAVTIMLLSILHVNVKIAMGLSILSAIPICLFVQNISFMEILHTALTGFTPKEEALSSMLSGGGVFSMLKSGLIVCISSSYSDIFNRTGLLDNVKHSVSSLAGKTNRFTALFCSSIGSAIIACNQTLTILLCNQLCSGLYKEKDKLAVDLEDTAVVIAPLIPWSIAGAVPLATVGAPSTAIFASFYLLLLPIYRLRSARYEKS